MKKSKITYHEDIFPASFIHTKGMIWVFPKFSVGLTKGAPMPVMLCGWQNDSDDVISLFHQSLQ